MNASSQNSPPPPLRHHRRPDMRLCVWLSGRKELNVSLRLGAAVALLAHMTCCHLSSEISHTENTAALRLLPVVLCLQEGGPATAAIITQYGRQREDSEQRRQQLKQRMVSFGTVCATQAVLRVEHKCHIPPCGHAGNAVKRYETCGTLCYVPSARHYRIIFILIFV